MSVLKTYEREWSDGGPPQGDPWPFYIIDDTGQIQTKDADGNGILGPDDAIAPGCWVSHRRGGGFGFVIAINNENLTILWSEEPKVVGNFANMAFPLVRRVFPPAFAPQLISIQPMTMPVGGIFYMDYKYPDPIMEQRCNEGPWLSRMFWRSYRCFKERIPRLWSSLSSWWVWQRGKKSTNAANIEQLNVDRQREVLTTLLQDPDRARKLIDKWSAVTQSTETPEPSEEDGPCP